MKITLYRNDIKNYIYFISSLSQNKMYGGLSSKSDLSGGIFDRYINIATENVFFNKILLPKISKDYSAISDFYVYKPINAGIAPDLIGIKVNNLEIPFSTFTNEGWVQYENAPLIEIKTFKADQYLLSLRNQHYDNQFLVLLELELNPAYLVSFFSDDIFDKSILESLKMNNDIFIAENVNVSIEQVKEIERKEDLGTLELIKITSAKNFMEVCDLCEPKISPQYIKEITETKAGVRNKLNAKLKNYVDENDGLYTFNDKWYRKIKRKNIKTLSMRITEIKAISIIQINKETIKIEIGNKSNCSINGIALKSQSRYIIKFGLLDRSSNGGEEYFMHKSLIDVVEDNEVDMINSIKNHIKEFENKRLDI